MWYVEQAAVALQKAMLSTELELQSVCNGGHVTGYFKACGLVDCSSVQVPRFFDQGSHTFLTFLLQVVHNWK